MGQEMKQREHMNQEGNAGDLESTEQRLRRRYTKWIKPQNLEGDKHNVTWGK